MLINTTKWYPRISQVKKDRSMWKAKRKQIKTYQIYGLLYNGSNLRNLTIINVDKYKIVISKRYLLKDRSMCKAIRKIWKLTKIMGLMGYCTNDSNLRNSKIIHVDTHKKSWNFNKGRSIEPIYLHDGDSFSAGLAARSDKEGTRYTTP